MSRISSQNLGCVDVFLNDHQCPISFLGVNITIRVKQRNTLSIHLNATLTTANDLNNALLTCPGNGTGAVRSYSFKINISYSFQE